MYVLNEAESVSHILGKHPGFSRPAIVSDLGSVPWNVLTRPRLIFPSTKATAGRPLPHPALSL